MDDANPKDDDGKDDKGNEQKSLKDLVDSQNLDKSGKKSAAKTGVVGSLSVLQYCIRHYSPHLFGLDPSLISGWIWSRNYLLLSLRPLWTGSCLAHLAVM